MYFSFRKVCKSVISRVFRHRIKQRALIIGCHETAVSHLYEVSDKPNNGRGSFLFLLLFWVIVQMRMFGKKQLFGDTFLVFFITRGEFWSTLFEKELLNGHNKTNRKREKQNKRTRKTKVGLPNNDLHHHEKSVSSQWWTRCGDFTFCRRSYD